MGTEAAVAAIFEPVAPLSTFEETVERLGTAIRLGLLSPGTRLPPERELAERLGISRSTLRQALTTLVQSGHLVSVRGRGGGTFVAEEPPLAAEPTERLRHDWREVLDQRVAVETGAALLAAERVDEPVLERMRELVERMAERPDFEEYRRADVRFHIAIAEATGSARLVAAMTEVQGELSDLIAHIAHPDAVLTHANGEHRRVVSALAAGDGPRAVRLLRRHLEGTEHILAGLWPGSGP
jgi:GntR family transcriptional regulator, transcriptional repressor for pyruvate dehydrogenase complex